MQQAEGRRSAPTARRAVAVASGAAGAVGTMGRMIASTIRLPGQAPPEARIGRAEPGARPGIDGIADLHTPPASGVIHIRCIEYSPTKVDTFDVDDVETFLAAPHPEDGVVRWVNVDGLHPYIVNRFREVYGFHTLAAEDVLHVPQRPVLEWEEDYIFVIARMLMQADERLGAEQVSMFIYDRTLITFQERKGDVWDPVRERINTEGSRLREHGCCYLLYTLLDAIVDQSFPILEHYGDVLEQIEAEVTHSPTTEMLRRIHSVKRDLVGLRRVMWPTRDLTDTLQRDEHGKLTKFTRTYTRDVYEHTIQVIDIIESYREMSSSLTDLYMSAVSNRMNEVMKVLTIMASFFIPITFLAGVYGMNFEAIPELQWKYAYPLFWIICATVIVGLFIFFRRRGWIGRS